MDGEDARKHQSEVDAWRAQGEKLGLLPQGASEAEPAALPPDRVTGTRPSALPGVISDDPVVPPDVPLPYANSHGNDHVEHTHAISVYMPESIEHEGQHFVPMSAAFRSAIDELEAGPQTGVKVI